MSASSKLRDEISVLRVLVSAQLQESEKALLDTAIQRMVDRELSTMLMGLHVHLTSASSILAKLKSLGEQLEEDK